MQHIVVETARQANLQAKDWVVNGAGRKGKPPIWLVELMDNLFCIFMSSCIIVYEYHIIYFKAIHNHIILGGGFPLTQGRSDLISINITLGKGGCGWVTQWYKEKGGGFGFPRGRSCYVIMLIFGALFIIVYLGIQNPIMIYEKWRIKFTSNGYCRQHEQSDSRGLKGLGFFYWRIEEDLIMLKIAALAKMTIFVMCQ